MRTAAKVYTGVSTEARNPAYQAYQILHWAFVVAPVLAGVDNKARVAQEEIFGPVVTIMRFSDEAEAVKLANDVIYGLAATMWTQDVGRAHRVAKQIKSGVVTINTPFTPFPGLPFGDYKQSGLGREISLEALDDYTNTHIVRPLGLHDTLYRPPPSLRQRTAATENIAP